MPGRLGEMARTKEGSQALQRQLRAMPASQLREACDELAPHLVELCTDPFGNYLISSMVCLPAAQPAIASALRGRALELATHAQGSRVLQAALEALPSSMASTLVSELEGHVAQVAMRTYGSWSVCTAYKASHAPFILAEIAAAVGTLATLQDGSRVVQRVLPEAAACGASVTSVLDALIELSGDLGRLASDAFGNYVVQEALRLVEHDSERQRRFVELLLPHLPMLSMSKAGSNVAEAVLVCLSTEQLAQARHTLLRDPSCDLATHRYGQHVVATLHKRAAALCC